VSVEAVLEVVNEEEGRPEMDARNAGVGEGCDLLSILTAPRGAKGRRATPPSCAAAPPPWTLR
jgi:hypothetical protein